MAAALRRGWSRGGGRALSRELPGSAESSGFSPGGEWTSQAPLELARTAASEIEAEERGRKIAESRPRRGPDAAGRWGPQDEAGKRGVAPRSSLAPTPAGGLVVDAALDPGRHEEAKNADHERGVGTWGRAPPRLGSAGADSCVRALLMPRSPQVPGSGGKGPRKAAVGPGSPGSFLEDWLRSRCFLACGWSPTTKATLEIQITGCGRPCRVLLSQRWVLFSWGMCSATAEVTLDTHSFATPHLLCASCAPRRWADSREQDPQV